jgi:hypothetical protein
MNDNQIVNIVFVATNVTVIYTLLCVIQYCVAPLYYTRFRTCSVGSAERHPNQGESKAKH